MVLGSTCCGPWYVLRDIRRRKPHAERSRCRLWCWRARTPAAAARRCRPAICHGRGLLCSGRRLFSTPPCRTRATSCSHRGRRGNWSHSMLLLAANAAAGRPSSHVQKEVIQLPRHGTARPPSTARTWHATTRQKERARQSSHRARPCRPPSEAEQPAPCFQQNTRQGFTLSIPRYL